MIPRARCEAAFRQAVIDRDPAANVRYSLRKLKVDGFPLGLAMGKAALAMARGAGPVLRGVAVTNADDGGELPAGWTKLVASHPEPDDRSLAAGDAVIDLVASARLDDVILVLISGGASALVERLAPGVTLDELRARVRAVMAGGAPIHAINAVRQQLSAIKGGKLAAMSGAPIVTLAISDVFDNDLAIIGSGPTIPQRPGDHAEVIVPCDAFAWAIDGELEKDDLGGPHQPTVFQDPMTGDVATVADTLVASISYIAGVAWGEPTVRVTSDHGEGGRMQQLALELAKRLRGGTDTAFCVGTDGIDGPPPPGRAAPAGAYVDGTTWDTIIAAGIDPQRALDRCDAGTALHAVGALVVTGPTGINHADVVIIG